MPQEVEKGIWTEKEDGEILWSSELAGFSHLGVLELAGLLVSLSPEAGGCRLEVCKQRSIFILEASYGRFMV